MPPKRKAGRAGGRPKRRREPSPDVEEHFQKRQRVNDDVDNDDDNGAIAPPETTKEGPVKLLVNTLVAEGDEDADGEEDDDKMDATHEEDADGEREVLESLDIGEDKEQQHRDVGHKAMQEGEEGNHTDREVETTSSPLMSTRGRGRARVRRTKGALPVPTRSSPRKGTQPPPASATSKPTNARGRKAARGKGRGVVTSDPSPTGSTPKPEEVTSEPRGKGKVMTEENKGHDRDVDEAEVTGSQQPSQHPQESPFQDAQQPVENPQQQDSSQIHADHALHTPADSFPSPAQTYYPNYPSQTGPFPYTYGAPQPPGSNASDARQYLPLRSDGTQPMYGTSFSTTVGTGHESGSASSSFNTPYAPSGAPAHALDANAPQGNPFPPSVPMAVPAYGTSVYGVGMSDDDDDEDQEPNVRAAPTKRKTQTGTTKIGGRAGRGDHVACHFCRGRKLKCDGRRPTCGHCTLRSLACAYDETVRRRGPGRKEKNNRRDRNGTGNPRRAGGMVVPDMSIGPQTPTQPLSLMTTSSTDGIRRKRRHAMQGQHAAHQSQTSVLRFDEADGTGMSSSGMKPASAAYGVASNERLGYYYAGGAPGQYPPQGPSYPPYGVYGSAASNSHHAQQPAYGYAQDGGEDGDGNVDIDAEGEGDGEHERFGSRPEEESSYGHPSNGDYTQAWPAEPPGGVPVSHPHA